MVGRLRAADRKALRALFGPGSCASAGWSAHQAGLRLKVDRPAASRLFQRSRRRGWVEHWASWSLTDQGRLAIAENS
jgi:hypothetical protein